MGWSKTIDENRHAHIISTEYDFNEWWTKLCNLNVNSNGRRKKEFVIENRPQKLNSINDSIKSRHSMTDADDLFSVNKIKSVVWAWSTFVISRVRYKRVKPLCALKLLFVNFSFLASHLFSQAFWVRCVRSKNDLLTFVTDPPSYMRGNNCSTIVEIKSNFANKKTIIAHLNL